MNWPPVSTIVSEVRAKRGGARAVDNVKRVLDRVNTLNPRLNAFTQVFATEALVRAAKIDRRVEAGENPGSLAGVPIAVKDNICTTIGNTTCGSRMLKDYRSPFNAGVVERLEAAGAIVVGKTNLDEFAMGSSTEYSVHGPTRNPWDTGRVPGGSSGGSAAAVAAGLVPAALGSDTGGSIRQPASHCGVTGLKPTYGRISRWGLVAYASSLDQIGPLARTAEDCAAVAAVIAGHDTRDSTSANVPATDFTDHLQQPLDKPVIGVPRQAHSSGNAPAVSQAFGAAIEMFRTLGATIVEIDPPHLHHAIAAYYIIATAEASSNLARFDGVRFGRRADLKPGEGLYELYCRSRSEGFGHEVQRRIMLGTHVLSSGYYDAYYLTALKVRRLIKGDFDAAWHKHRCTAVLMPTSPGPAFPIGSKTDDPLAMYLEDIYTVGVNLAGLPAISLPAGFAREGGKDLPIGVQLIGPALGEGSLLRAAHMFQRATEWHGRTPPE